MIRFKLFSEDKYSKYNELLDKKKALIQTNNKDMSKAVAKAMLRVDKQLKEIEKKIGL